MSAKKHLEAALYGGFPQHELDYIEPVRIKTILELMESYARSILPDEMWIGDNNPYDGNFTQSASVWDNAQENYRQQALKNIEQQ